MLPQDLQLQLFLYYPSYTIYFTLKKKSIAEKLLEDLPSLTTENYTFCIKLNVEEERKNIKLYASKKELLK
jgi:hypothetical protein